MKSVKFSYIATAATVVFLVTPFLIVAGASFGSGNNFALQFPPRDFSFVNYRSIPFRYIEALGTSVIVGVVVSGMATVLGLMAAIALVRGQLIGRQAVDAFFRLPVQIPMIVTGAVFLQFYYELGSKFGVHLLDSVFGLIAAHLFITLPYCIGAISTVLARFDRTLEEAAESLGATRWGTFRRVTLPIIRPGIITGAFYAFVVSFGNVPISLFIGDGRSVTLPVSFFQDLQMDFQPGILALSTLIVFASLLLVLGLQKFGGLQLILRSKVD
jgi:putative spermidine/putrescine transport system permease protein